MELPDKREYRDYYAIIKRPISLEMIRKRINGNHYTSLQGFKEDFRTIFQNARQYNEEGSLVVEDADALEVLSRFYFQSVANDCRLSFIASWKRSRMERLRQEESLLIPPPTRPCQPMYQIRLNRWGERVSN